MKPDKLEQFILRNRDGFDQMEPSPEVWDRIGKRKAPLIRIDWRDAAWKAAAVAVIFTASYFFHDFISSRKADSRQEAVLPSDDPIVRDLLEAEVFYTSRINSRKDELFRLASGNPVIRKEVISEFAELDLVYQELKEDLKDNADNTEVIEAMIQNYRIKLEILEELLYQVKEANNTQNESGHENKSLHI